MKITPAKSAGTIKDWRKKMTATKPEQSASVHAEPAALRRLIRDPQLFTNDEAAIRDIAENLGIPVSRLNDDQRRVIVGSRHRALTNRQWRQLIEDAS